MTAFWLFQLWVTGASDADWLTIEKAELNFNPGNNVPQSGWLTEPLPANSLARRALPNQNGVITAWAKTYFAAPQFAGQPIALYIENSREGLTVILNGAEIFRNAPDENAWVSGWNHPYLVPIPQSLLADGQNEVIIRVTSLEKMNLSIGQIKIGKHTELVDHYNTQHILRISGPMAANFAMLFLTAGILVLYFIRRSEYTLIWMTLTGIFWFIRNYHFFAYKPPFDPRLYQEITYYSTFFAIASSLSFSVAFLQLPARTIIIKIMFALCLILSLMRFVVVQLGGQDGFVNIAALAIVVCVAGLMAVDWRRNPSIDHALLVSVVALVVVLSVHDLGRSASLAWWEGLGFHAQPYIGLSLFAVFLVSMGRRFTKALSEVERANRTLELRVATARAELVQSELARRELEILSAVEGERERLMREMHDGIGSNLITALAIAKQADESPRTINTLKRAISDLKITVDSLAPVEGDLVSLLANFRHRLEPDLREAGLKCVWKVEPCPALPWLDAINALQMLRIIQEGVSNVLVHAHATIIEIGAMPCALEAVDGIQIWISDDGIGWQDGVAPGTGRGFANMQARAKSLGGIIDINSVTGTGLRVGLWLPIVRDER